MRRKGSASEEGSSCSTFDCGAMVAQLLVLLWRAVSLQFQLSKLGRRAAVATMWSCAARSASSCMGRPRHVGCAGMQVLRRVCWSDCIARCSRLDRAIQSALWCRESSAAVAALEAVLMFLISLESYFNEHTVDSKT